MTSLSSLAPELLAHILHLSTEGEPAAEQQRARFSFGRVARAFYLATADATSFYVAGEAQARALVVKLEKERELAAQEEREADTRTRVSNIRRLALVVDGSNVDIFASLIRAVPDLVVLDLDIELVTNPSLSPLEEAVGRLTSLRELRHCSYNLEGSHLIRILTPLTELQVLDLDFEICLTPSDTPPSMANLPHLHTLRTSVFGNPDVFVDALVLHALGSGLETLDLKWSGFDTISPEENVTAMIPHLANLAYLTWASDQVRLDRITQVAVRAVIAAMTGLQSISIVMWTLVDYRGDEDDSDHLHVDPRFFDTLKTLPALHTVELFVREAELEDEDLVISFIESAEALRSLHIHLETLSGWTRGQRDRVEAAAVAAGVVFVYPYSGVV